jgi:hypothetical protein
MLPLRSLSFRQRLGKLTTPDMPGGTVLNRCYYLAASKSTARYPVRSVDLPEY